jgi:hypothetical protein
MGSEMRLDKVYCYVASASGNQTLTVTPYTTLTNDPSAPVTASGQSRAFTGEKMFQLAFARNAEGLELEIAQATNTLGHIGLQQLALDWTDFGVEDSGK